MVTFQISFMDNKFSLHFQKYNKYDNCIEITSSLRWIISPLKHLNLIKHDVSKSSIMSMLTSPISSVKTNDSDCGVTNFAFLNSHI